MINDIAKDRLRKPNQPTNKQTHTKCNYRSTSYLYLPDSGVDVVVKIIFIEKYNKSRPYH